MRVVEPILDIIDVILAWMGLSLGQFSEEYCLLESAEDPTTLVARDGSLVSLVKVHGATFLVGPEEFEKIHKTFTQSLQVALSRPGYAVQAYFFHDKEVIEEDLSYILMPARRTAEKLELKLQDLFQEKIQFLKRFCNTEGFYLVLWTRPNSMSKTQAENSMKNRTEKAKAAKIPLFHNAQRFLVGIPELRDAHHSFVNMLLADLNGVGLFSTLLEVHDACRVIRSSLDRDFTATDWQATLPGDKIVVRETKNYKGDVSDVLWPPLAQQLIPRDGSILGLRHMRLGDRIYASISIELFPKQMVAFAQLLRRVMAVGVPWRISFMIESGGMQTLGFKSTLASILSFASNDNKLINGAIKELRYLENNTDEAIVKLRVMASTWAKAGSEQLLQTRAAELAKALQGWGFCEVSENAGDPYLAALSSSLGLSTENVATAAVAPLSDVTYMLPLTRPASLWETGAVLFRSPDGKPWPYQPGSSLQTTWIDIVYARPGSGKSVLSNSINLALCLSAGIQRLPRIAIIDIGPSSSGLISLIKESLPPEKQHLVTYQRLRMVKEMSINPFDTQLGARLPSPQDRAFLVNFLTLLATPIGMSKTYDGIADMAGLIVDELYKNLAPSSNPRLYSANLEPRIDAKIMELSLAIDDRSTWWEVVDALFAKEEIFLAEVAQRYAMPLLADAAAICRNKTIEDLYGSIKTPTGENIIDAFGRMLSSAIREYPILANPTSFDLGDARIVSLDLDEVAKTGGDAADRQTAIMYMLARYVMARNFYLTEDSLQELPKEYRPYHAKRIIEIQEDPKRIVFDEFHRTSKAQAVRDQVLVDMREGRKWKVQVALLSQSIEDFDSVMIEFATSIFIMDAGPKQAVEKSAQVFGLSPSAKDALEHQVHGPRADGATFLAQFATKHGINMQVLTSTIGPIELWAFNTTAEDVRIRNALYKRIGAASARKVLASLYPSGSAAKLVEQRLNMLKKEKEHVSVEQSNGVIDELIEEIIRKYEASLALT
jgi:intracellular multiplication protein IcmB